MFVCVCVCVCSCDQYVAIGHKLPHIHNDSERCSKQLAGNMLPYIRLSMLPCIRLSYFGGFVRGSVGGFAEIHGYVTK